MNENDFLVEMQDVLDTEDSLTMDDVLADNDDWDSLSIVNFLANMSLHSDKKIMASEVKEAKTIRDLYNLL